MLQAFSFQAEPIIGRESEQAFDFVEGFIICSFPDPESFLRDRLSELGLYVVEVHYTADPSPENIANLPETKKQEIQTQGWCMVIQEKHRDA